MKEERLSSWQQILGVLILGGTLYSLIGIEDLYRWSRELESPKARIVFTGLLSPIHSLAQSISIEGWAVENKSRFHRLKEQPLDRLFPGFTEKSKELFEDIVLWSRTFSSETETEAAPLIVSTSPDPIPVIDEIELTPNDYPEPVEEEIQKSLPQAIPAGESILLVGDSLANSCGTAFVPLVEHIEELNLLKYGRVSANLSNSIFKDWFNELDEILNSEFDIIIVMMGANAAQAIIEEENRWEYGTSRWEEIYRQRAFELIQKMKLRTSEIYWVGIPPMRKRNYKENMLIHNKRISEICDETGIRYLPINNIIGDEAGEYTDYKIIGGREVRIRSTDSIHYTKAGSDLLSRYILSSLFPDINLTELN